MNVIIKEQVKFINNTFVLFGVIILSYLILSFVSKEILNTDELLIDYLLDQFTVEQVKESVEFQKKWEWLSFVLFPILMLIKASIIAAIIDAGCFFFEKEIKYEKLVNIVLKAEFSFLLAIVFKFFWFYTFQQDYTLEDLKYFSPLSVLNIIGYEGLQTWFIYPLQVLNVFEIAYWFILAYLIGKELKIKTEKGFSIVASSYGVGLLIWVVAVMFFTLNMS